MIGECVVGRESLKNINMREYGVAESVEQLSLVGKDKNILEILEGCKVDILAEVQEPDRIGSRKSVLLREEAK